jgi:hypothetical protein
MLAAVLLFAGLSLLADGAFGFSPVGVLEGVASQLSTTLPAAVLVLLATALNLAAGAIAVRAIRGRPFDGAVDAILGGYLGAVLLDLVLLALLGGTGLFKWPVLASVHLAILAAGTRLRPVVIASDPSGLGRASIREMIGWAPIGAIIGIGWIGLLALQLASPVVPFVDVLPNHVAPVEHLRTFGDFGTLTTTPSPIYGPSRTFLGYVALLGVVDTLIGLPAALGVAAFALPGAVAVAAGMHRLGSAVGGGQTGMWAVLAFVLTTSFVRLPDARATVLVLPLAAWCLAELAEAFAGRRAVSLRGSLLSGAAIAAAILVHPVIGALTAMTVVILTLAGPRPAQDHGAPALATGAVLALPQLAAMLELPVATWLALAVVPLAVGAGWLISSNAQLRNALVVAGRGLGVVALIAGVAGILVIVPAAQTALGRIMPTMPVLLLTILVGALLAPRRFLSPVLLAILAAGAIAATATELAPAQGTLLTALRFEVPKTLHYWLPIGIAVAAAISLDTIWRDERRWLPGAPAWMAPRLAVVLFLVAAILPLRAAPLEDPYHLGERRLSETVALQLRWAERGYWQGYPDPRRLVAPDQAAILDAVRGEIAAGRLRSTSEVLHVARSFQQWVALPLGVFTGVIETSVSPDAEVSIHTVGGRLHRLDELGTLLGARPPYVLLERSALPAQLRDQIVAAGYRPTFVNGRGELFVRGS